MDREEYFKIIEDIRNAHKSGDMESILRFSRELDLSKVKDVPALEMIADAYYASGDIPAARDMLLDAYDMAFRGRGIAYKLSEICVTTSNIKDAVGFYSDFCKIAPKDSRRYILKYKIAKAGGVEPAELINILEEYISLEPDDEYMYELAKLYHEQGANEKCIGMCDNLAVWYSDGIYLEKALELKSSLSELSPRQMQVYEAAKAERELQEKAKLEAMSSSETSNEVETEGAEDSVEIIEVETVNIEDEAFEEDSDTEADDFGVQLTFDLEKNPDESADPDSERLRIIEEAVNSATPEVQHQLDFEDDFDTDIKIYTPETSIENIDADSAGVIDFDEELIADDIIGAEAESEVVNEYFSFDDEDEFFGGYGFEGDITDREPEGDITDREPEGDITDREPEGKTVEDYDEESLSDEMCEEVSEYLMIEDMEENLIRVTSIMAERILAGDGSGGNLIVTGEAKSGKTYLTLAIIKEIKRKAGIGTGRVAKVQAEALNGKSVSKVLAKVSGNDLVIENVGLLEDKTIQDLIEALKDKKFNSIISLEDNILAVDSILGNFPELEKIFENRIDIHELSMTQWAEVACDYAAERGYSVTDIAVLALHTKIDEKNVASARFGMDDVIDIIEDAIYHAEGRGASKRRGRKRRGLIELTESDFQS